MSVPYLPAFLS